MRSVVVYIRTLLHGLAAKEWRSLLIAGPSPGLLVSSLRPIEGRVLGVLPLLVKTLCTDGPES